MVLIDGSGYLVFHERHCDHCLTQQHGETTLYMHQVLEAKLLGPAGTVFSIGTEFIDNRDAVPSRRAARPGTDQAGLRVEGAAASAGRLRAEFPQLRICLNGDGLFACGEGFQIAKDYKCDYIYVFQAGADAGVVGGLPGVAVVVPRAAGGVDDAAGDPAGLSLGQRPAVHGQRRREWSFNAIACEETKPDGNRTWWAWVTSLEVNRETVVEVATKGGRERWRTENEGFNTQKNSGLNLEHAYSHTCWAAYYLPVADRPPAVAIGGEGEPAAATWRKSRASGRPWSCSAG